mmetsp:Transcript_21162/g.29918  ORF Transcript_21162/g.29918 Transcript_21162/m.29918 type:complete len:311 (+) Transcript_21162:76-1008(+)
MAPNRKNITHLVDSLEGLDVANVVQAKFLPLTHATEEFKHVQQKQVVLEPRIVIEPKVEETKAEEKEEEYIVNNETQESYWDWEPEEEVSEKDQLIQQILKEEEIRQKLSSSRIEENLVKDAAESKEEDVEFVESAENSDDYWNEAPAVVTAQHLKDATHPKNNYWDWEDAQMEDKNKSMIDTILRDEAARQLLTVSHVEQTLMKAAPVVEDAKPTAAHDSYWTWDSACVAPHVVDETHPRNNYWDWETKEEEEVQNGFVAAIMKEEKIRLMLTAEHVQEQLVKEAATVGTAVETVVAEGAEDSASYWEM